MNPAPESKLPLRLVRQIETLVQGTPVDDIHTHLYDPAFGSLLLWGIDDLLVYHYLVAEVFRYLEIPYAQFWGLSKSQQADLIWENLFIQHSPISEACRGVLTTLNALGLDVKKRDLPAIRKWFGNWTAERYVTRCLELGGVRKVCMTNSPFDDSERKVWERGFVRDPRFVAGLRIDPLLLNWLPAAKQLAAWGYKVDSTLSAKTMTGVRKFLADWTRRIEAKYLMVSLPPDFAFPGKTAGAQVLEKAILPHCREFGLPFALMPGVLRSVNPALGLAGDGEASTDFEALRQLCANYPRNKFLVTVLARENQHELCVLARKFRNLHIFGCWWFMNVPSLVDEVTRMRLELIGLSFTPQHSDARVLDQVIYKWRHSRQVIGRVLIDAYSRLAATGWHPSIEEIERDVQDLFGGAFDRFCRANW